MSDGVTSDVTVSVISIHTQNSAPESAEELAPDFSDHEIIGDLAQEFDRELKNAVFSVRRSIEEVEAALMVSAPHGSGGGGLTAAIGKLFHLDSASSMERKLADLRNIRAISVVLERVGEAFPTEYDLYRQSVLTLNAVLSTDGAYHSYLTGLDQAAKLRGVNRVEMRSLLNDPFVQSEDVKELRNALKAVIGSPTISPLFEEVESRYNTVDRMMADVASGTKALGAKGVDMSEFRQVADLAERMAKHVERPDISKPGGNPMDPIDNSISENLKKIAVNIREMIERLLNDLKAKFSPAGPAV